MSNHQFLLRLPASGVDARCRGARVHGCKRRRGLLPKVPLVDSDLRVHANLHGPRRFPIPCALSPSSLLSRRRPPRTTRRTSREQRIGAVPIGGASRPAPENVSADPLIAVRLPDVPRRETAKEATHLNGK